MHEFDAYWKATGRIEPRDPTVKEQMRIAFRAGSRDTKARIRGELEAMWTKREPHPTEVGAAAELALMDEIVAALGGPEEE